MANYIESQFTINYYDLSMGEEASPITMLRLLEETACDHHILLGDNVVEISKKNLGWVLLAGVMRFDRYPKYKEKVTIRTWLSQYKPVRGMRENLVFDAQGNIIGRAKGWWLFFDVKKRRPLIIPDKFRDIWGLIPDTSIDFNINQDIPILDEGEIMDVIKVKKFDIDANKHVNNLRYFQWLIEVIPDKVWKENFLYQIQGKFLNEANYGDQLVIYTKILKMNKEFLHTVFDRTTNKVCGVAHTWWKNRE